jgi:hypothetical protein
MFRSAGCSLLRAEGFSCSLCSLDVLYGGLGISKLQFFNQKKANAAHFLASVTGGSYLLQPPTHTKNRRLINTVEKKIILYIKKYFLLDLQPQDPEKDPDPLKLNPDSQH